MPEPCYPGCSECKATQDPVRSEPVPSDPDRCRTCAGVMVVMVRGEPPACMLCARPVVGPRAATADERRMAREGQPIQRGRRVRRDWGE